MLVHHNKNEFSKWREMEIFAETQVYFCDAGSPQQK
ncbi:IS30 family transposase, partial [Spiroplasma sp. ChiS]